MKGAAALLDGLLETSIVGSFTKVGYRSRQRLHGWTPVADHAASSGFAGSRVLLTGATSGLGEAAARELVELGAELHIVGRDPARTTAAARRLSRADAVAVTAHVADLADLAAVADFCDEFTRTYDHLDVLIHNAGALVHDYRQADCGHEETYTAQVLAPQLLTGRLLPLLSPGGRVVVVSSGGMYAEALRPRAMEMREPDYDGVRAYARAKRAQVELVSEWARRHPDRDVVFHAMHPGWADTPGVRSALPGFHRATRLLLRTPAEGADTVVWLAISPDAAHSSGGFWLDRAQRPTHRLWLPGGSADKRAQLWDLVTEQIAAALDQRPVSRLQKSNRASTT